MRRTIRLASLFGFSLLLSAVQLSADCPSATETQAFLASQPLDQASRSARFDSPVPEDLYKRAIAKPNKPIPLRTASRIQVVLLSELPIEALWQAINDDHHHAEVGYLPVRASEVVAGRPGHGGREVFQYFVKAGFGRWWVVQLEANEPLFRSSGEVLWELRWQDTMESYQDSGPPVRVGASVRPIKKSRGAWLLVRLGDECTLIEYFGEADPGGFAAAVQWLGLTRTSVTTMNGIVSIATEHLAEPHPRGWFVRPDGSSMDAQIP
jgi:hypothetical protein